MPHDEKTAVRIRAALAEMVAEGLVEKKMFGGLCFLVRGNMAAGLLKGDLIVRVGVDRFTEALAQPNTRLFDITGKPMKGWVMVAAAGYRTKKALQAWLRRGVDLALSLPAK